MQSDKESGPEEDAVPESRRIHKRETLRLSAATQSSSLAQYTPSSASVTSLRVLPCVRFSYSEGEGVSSDPGSNVAQGEEMEEAQRQEPSFLPSYSVPQASVMEMDWGGWDVSPSSASNTSASLTPTRIFNPDNLLSVASSAATSESTTGSDESVVQATAAAAIAELACPIPDESIIVDQYGFIVRDGERKTGSADVDPIKVVLCRFLKP